MKRIVFMLGVTCGSFLYSMQSFKLGEFINCDANKVERLTFEQASEARKTEAIVYLKDSDNRYQMVKILQEGKGCCLIKREGRCLIEDENKTSAFLSNLYRLKNAQN